MKTLYLVLIISTLAISASAQVFQGQKANSIASGAEMIRMKDFTKVPNYIRFGPDNEIPFEKALEYSLNFIKIEGAGFSNNNSFQDKLGFIHTRLYQTINGVPVEYAAWVVHETNGLVKSMNGNILSNAEIIGNFSISKDQALNYALQYVDAELYIFNADKNQNPYNEEYSTPIPEKVYLPNNGKLESAQLIAAYKIDVFALKPYSRQYVYVSAIDGSILHTETRIYTADVPGTAETGYSGTQTITTDSYGGAYRLRETGRGNGIATYNCNMTTNNDSGDDFVDDDNYWDNANADLDEYAADAHFATEKTYDYYYNVHGRNSIDNNGFALNSYIHYNLVEAGYSSNVNAFWNGSVMTYGDGSETVGPLTTVDVCAHEITHGLTSHTSNLTYQDESGALNEAFSDIFAVAVEYYAVPALADWTIAEDIGYSFRSVADPNSYNLPDTYLGNHWHFDTSDHGGVHTNMGVLCYWFYLISESGSGTNDNGDSYNISGLGMDNAAEITHRLQTIYLTNSSNYLDARFYGIQSAIDFYGACSSEVEEVTNAFYAIGVGGEYVNEVVSDFDANYTENCVPPFTVNFYNYSINGSDFSWDFGDGSSSTEVNPEHTYTTMGEFNVQLYSDGGTCGDDTELKEDFISINVDNPCMTFMPSNGTVSTDRCVGTLYDVGGPGDPYYNSTNASYTIEPDNASQIMLNITEFDIEAGTGTSCDYDYIAFYDGPSIASPLINDTYYCNTTGNPGTIISSGGAITIKFVSDSGLSLEGFEIEWQCLLDTEPPVASFISDINYTCSGVVQFTDLSLNNPNTYLWDFGDENTSTEENPLHIFTQSGTYTVSLTVSNDNGENTYQSTSQITVALDEAIAIEDATVCIDSLFTLTVNEYGENLNWYSDEQCSVQVFTGSTWVHPPIQNDTQYYIREFTEENIQNVGATNNTQGGGPFGNVDYIHYLVFDAYQAFTLLSVNVNADGSGNRLIALKDDVGSLIEMVQVYCPQGVSRIDLNIEVPAGENLRLVGLGSPDLFRTNESSYLNYPYEIEDVLSIKHSSASNGPTDYYYFFYDWEVMLPTCESEPASLNITAIDCTTSISISNGQEIKVYPNPVSNMLNISGVSEISETITISLTDLSGRVILIKQITENTSIDTESLRSGAYLLNFSGKGIERTAKIIKY